MKKSFYLIPALALVLASCGGQKASQNQESEANNVEQQEVEIESADPITKKVNWDKPIFALDENGDTVQRWIYNDKGQLIENVNGITDRDTYYSYDANGNVVSAECDKSSEYWTYDELGRVSTYHNEFLGARWQYEYDGNMCKAIKKEDNGYEVYHKTYYLDKEMKYDTLYLWGKNGFDNDDWTSKTQKKYTDILGKKYISEESEFFYGTNDESCTKYEYNKLGAVTKKTYTNEKGEVVIYEYEYNRLGAVSKEKVTNKKGEVTVEEKETEDNWIQYGPIKTYYSWE